MLHHTTVSQEGYVNVIAQGHQPQSVSKQEPHITISINYWKKQCTQTSTSDIVNLLHASTFEIEMKMYAVTKQFKYNYIIVLHYVYSKTSLNMITLLFYIISTVML